jgi:hypothetical protein
MLDYARRALDFLPTPLTDIGIASQKWYTHNYDLTTKQGWDDLLDDVDDEFDDADEGDEVRWLAIVPIEPILALAHAGIAYTPGNVALARQELPEAGAHELGHCLGLNHIHLPTGGPKEPSGPYDTADNAGNLRRPPFDVRPSQAVSMPAGDLMSYMPRVRPGITTWMRLFAKNLQEAP